MYDKKLAQNMEGLDSLVKKYHLDISTHKITEDENCLIKLLRDNKCWIEVFHFSDNTLLKEFFKSLKPKDRDDYFFFGLASFQCFIQANFTGPEIPKDIEEFLQCVKINDLNLINKSNMNSDDINVNMKYPALLVISEAIFECCIVDEFVNLWWCVRALIIHQEVLDDLSPALLTQADRMSKALQGFELPEGYVKAQLEIELARMYLKFHHMTRSAQYIDFATRTLSVEYSYFGMLGKRTRHQTKDLPQLAVEITLQDNPNLEREEVEELPVPKNLNLEDDVRLDNIAFKEEQQFVKLPNIEQKLILTIVQHHLISKPSQELNIEEILPFLQYLLRQNNTYCVRVMTLLLRCQMENKHRRTVERCIKQTEDIIKYFNASEPEVKYRIADVFGTGFLPIWKVKGQFGDLLLNFGLVQDSLDVYLEIQSWDEVIVCYSILGRRSQAAEKIQMLLDIKPTVRLMCLLGDATDDVTCYEKAWEMSKKRSHRAQRHWGQYLYNRKQFTECIPHYEKSLSINPLQSRIWARLGIAALEVENWQTAATAYRRYANLEPDNFDAWNNLAQAYIKIGNVRSAHYAILEALKCNFDNWKVWENLLVISSDISNYEDVIRAYHRLLDMKGKYVNVEVLKLLVFCVLNDTNESEENSARKFLPKTRELLGRLVTQDPENGAVWELYACLAPAMLLRAQRLQRAYRGYARNNWDKSPQTCQQVLHICDELATVVLDDEIDPANCIVNSIKLNLSSAVGSVRKHNWKETKEVLETVTSQLDLVMQKMKKAQNAFQISNKEIL